MYPQYTFKQNMTDNNGNDIMVDVSFYYNHKTTELMFIELRHNGNKIELRAFKERERDRLRNECHSFVEYQQDNKYLKQAARLCPDQAKGMDYIANKLGA